jgi:hypothetical protein
VCFARLKVEYIPPFIHSSSFHVVVLAIYIYQMENRFLTVGLGFFCPTPPGICYCNTGVLKKHRFSFAVYLVFESCQPRCHGRFRITHQLSADALIAVSIPQAA